MQILLIASTNDVTVTVDDENTVTVNDANTVSVNDANTVTSESRRFASKSKLAPQTFRHLSGHVIVKMEFIGDLNKVPCI